MQSLKRRIQQRDEKMDAREVAKARHAELLRAEDEMRDQERVQKVERWALILARTPPTILTHANARALTCSHRARRIFQYRKSLVASELAAKAKLENQKELLQGELAKRVRNGRLRSASRPRSRALQRQLAYKKALKRKHEISHAVWRMYVTNKFDDVKEAMCVLVARQCAAWPPSHPHTQQWAVGRHAGRVGAVSNAVSGGQGHRHAGASAPCFKCTSQH